MKTTKQLIHECFCKKCAAFLNNTPHRRPMECIAWATKDAARAARRFVKAEQREKLHNKIRSQFKGKCKIVVEKGGYNLVDALKRAEERKRK